MDQFHGGQHVRLRSRARGGYLHADRDGRGVSLRERRASRRSAWLVHVPQGDGFNVLLQGAAYGRYLSFTAEPAAVGHLGLRAGQRDLGEEEAMDAMWQPVVSGSEDDVLLLYLSGSYGIRYLRANGRYGQWQTGVTVDAAANLSSMMYWAIEPIPRREAPPPLPPPRPSPGLLALLLGRGAEEERWREVRHVRAGPDGTFSDAGWVAFQFAGRSVASLRSELALRLGEEPAALAMCVRAGQYARLTPLVVDLPASDDTLDIVVLTAGSPVDLALHHPDIDAA